MDGIVTLAVVAGGFFVISVLVGAVLVLVGLAFGLLGCGISGAVRLFVFAAEQGFIGIAAYAACWFFMLPVMLVASVIVGWIAIKAEEITPHTPLPRSPEEIAAQWREEDGRYEEHRQILVEKARLRGEREDP